MSAEPAPVSTGVPSSTRELLAAAADLEGSGAEAILTWTFRRYRRVALVASFQVESIVLIEMASGIRPGVEVITLDTGRLPQETHDIIDRVQRRFPITLRVIPPDPIEIETMVAAHGVNLFYASPELRHLCCRVRKAHPLSRALRGYEAWVTGLRREQAAARRETPVVARDGAHGGIAKVAPLVRWSHDDVWAYARQRSLPIHSLYSRGYTSIGCSPCTRATRRGETERAGRWWWEHSSVKECGLHFPPSAPPPDATSGSTATHLGAGT